MVNIFIIRKQTHSPHSSLSPGGVLVLGGLVFPLFSPGQGSLKGLILLNIGAALFGSNQVAIKEAEEVISAGTLTALRFGLAALIFSPAAFRGLQDKRIRDASLELGFWLFLGYSAQAVGLVTTDASRGAFTGTFTVLTVPILVSLLDRDRSIPISTWGAAVAAIFGVSLLVGDPTSTPPNAGDLWCIISAVMFGIHKFRTESVTSCIQDTTALVACQLSIVAVSATLICIPEASTYVHQLAAEAASGADVGTALWENLAGWPWLNVLYMGLMTTALTLWIEVEALKDVSAPLAALIYSAEPLWGALFAWLILDERWGTTGWVGAALVVASSLFGQNQGDPTRKPAAVCEPAAEDDGDVKGK